THCDVSKHTTDSPLPALERSQHGDVIQFDSAPDTATPESSVQVTYKCTKACRVGVELVLSTPDTSGLVSFRRTWTHVKKFGDTRTRTVQLTFPSAVLYKRDFYFRRPVDASNVMVRAWLVHLDGEESGSSNAGISQYHQSLVRTFKFLQVLPISERPAQPRTRSVAWGAELMWNLTKDRPQQCSPESDVVDLLVFPFASTGEKYGVIRTFSTFINRELETARYRATEQPRALSEFVCCEGEVTVQVHLASRETKAFTAHTPLSLLTWIRLDLFIDGSKAKLKIIHADSTEDVAQTTHSYDFQDPILHNDTSGYFVIGGDIYMPGILGYFGPIRYHRLGAEKVENPLSPVRTLKLLDESHTECEEMRQFTEDFLYALQDGQVSHGNDVCQSYYEGLRRTYTQPRCMQTWSWDQQVKHSSVLKIFRMQEEEMISGPWNSRRMFLFRQQLFQDVLRSLGEAGALGVGADVVSYHLELLQVCSCWGHHQASLMLATLHQAGLRVPPDQEKGHVYSLMGGLGDERLSLLHLGYKHMQGLDGFPKDQDMAYAYYANMGRQTSLDRDKFQDSEWGNLQCYSSTEERIEQTITEHVHVTSAQELQMQTGDEGDVAQFLKLQAERGDIESQKTLARMLFWGSNGMMKDIGEAVRWYARSGLQMTDATAMYDYGILLLKGTGVKKNRTLGLKLLQKAADMGSATALNGLGWYYSTLGKDDRKAVYYFELAARNGSRDGVFNLGVYHLKGANPDTPWQNETAAFECFLKAGEMGHVEGAVEAASYLSRGVLEGVRRDPEKAVMYVPHMNQYDWMSVCTSMNQYDWVLKHSSACQWRYHNYSTYNYAPHESGLLKMGDHYSAVGDMVKAIALYSRAAVHGSPQGLYNLAVLTEEGYSIPGTVLEQMQIPTEDHLGKSTVVEELLLRCRKFEGEKADLSPCALTLFGVQLRKAWRDFTHSTIQLTLAWGTLTVLLLFVLGIVIQSAVSHYFTAPISRPSNQSSERESDPVNQLSREHVLDAAIHQGGFGARLELNGRPRMTQNGQALQEAADLVFTVTGVCVCTLFAMFISHLF
ncbi:hypothetical protein NFI96_022637, partial [Prochilodus magdalenae]